jgi:hypothetical protein
MNRFTLSRRQRAGTKRPARARPVLEPLEGRSLLSNPTLGPLEQVLAAGQPTPSGAAGQAAASWITLDDPKASGSTVACGISGNNIVGWYRKPQASYGFLYDGTTYTTLKDPLGPDGTCAYGIDGKNVVGGVSYYDKHLHSNVERGFLYNGSTYTTLDDPLAANATSAYGISGNNIVGDYVDRNVAMHGFLYNGTTGTYTTLDDPLAATGTTSAQGISGNNIVGYYSDWYNAKHGFLYNGTTYTTLDDPLAPYFTWAMDISGSNIVGYYQDASGAVHGFLYNGTTGAYMTLDDPSASNWTEAMGISGSNIVGYYLDASGISHGFLYQTGSVPAAASEALTAHSPGGSVTSYDAAGANDLAVKPGQTAAVTPSSAASPVFPSGADMGVTPSLWVSGALSSSRARRVAHRLVADLGTEVLVLVDPSWDGRAAGLPAG